MLDMVGLTGKKPVPEGTAFNQPEIEAALKRQGNMKIEKGDVVIFYTGWHTLLGVDDKVYEGFFTVGPHRTTGTVQAIVNPIFVY